MALIIDKDTCCGCGVCEANCQMRAVFEDTLTGKYEINPDLCLECGICADSCPTGSIS